jgi:hypothetical protein
MMCIHRSTRSYQLSRRKRSKNESQPRLKSERQSAREPNTEERQTELDDSSDSMQAHVPTGYRVESRIKSWSVKREA